MPLLNAFRRAMGELDVGGRIISTDITIASPAFHRADLGLLVPPASDDAYIPTLLEMVREHNVGLLVPLTDLDLQPLADNRKKFASAGCSVMIGNEETIHACRDKRLTAELVRQAGLPTIKTVTIQQFRKNPFYPCFIKPTHGSAAIGTSVIDSEEQLDAHMAIYGQVMLVQEYVAGQEFTIDVFRSRDGKVRCVVPRQRLSVRSGEVETAVTVKDDQLIADAVALSAVLDDIWGVFCCQCRRPEGKAARFFEINPRFGGGAPLSIAAGANLPLYVLQEVLGEPITAELGNFADAELMMRYEDAVFTQVNDPHTLPGFETPRFR